VWHAIFEQSCIVIAVMLCAIAVKFVDDFLDQDLDTHAGSRNFTTQFGNGTVVYAMLALALAASLNTNPSIPLFLASYSVGMFHDLKQPFPTGLSGWQESLFVFLFGVMLWGWQIMLFAILFIASIQLFDDYVDVCTDQLVGYRNIASRIGKVECLLLSIITMLSAYWVCEPVFLSVFLGTFLFYGVLFFYQKGEY